MSYSSVLLRCTLTSLALLASTISLAAPEITHGVSAGDVTSTSAVIWARTDRVADMWVSYYTATGQSDGKESQTQNSAATDYAAQVKLTELQPGTQYRYEVRFEDRSGTSKKQAGLFRTAPLSGQKADVSLIWGGDLAGQTYCRQVGSGYEIFEPMTAIGADFYVANGDMIYADNACPAKGPLVGWVNVPGGFPGIGAEEVDWTNVAAVREVYNQHWRYNRSDPAFQKFLRVTPQYVQWDDHEVINDFGANWPEHAASPNREGYPNIVAAGLKSMFDFHPIDRHPEEPNRIYRSYRWGQHAELFIVDARSYRSRNVEPDTREVGKTMLGAPQLAWLKKSLSESTATWKIISNDVPLSIPTGSGAVTLGRDAFADGKNPFTASANLGLASTTGFERELLDLLGFLDKANVANIVFISTDVHFAAQLRYEQDFNDDGDNLLFHELVSGPLSAIRNPAPPALDSTLHPVVLYAEGDIFNFGTIRIEKAHLASLTTDIRDETGRIRPGSELKLLPQGMN